MTGEQTRAAPPAPADERLQEIRERCEKATPGEWHHVQAYKSVPPMRTIHGPVEGHRCDYVSTWPGMGTPPGHRVIIPMEGRESHVSSDDMAFIAAAKQGIPYLLDVIASLQARVQEVEGAFVEAAADYRAVMAEIGVESIADVPARLRAAREALDAMPFLIKEMMAAGSWDDKTLRRVLETAEKLRRDATGEGPSITDALAAAEAERDRRGELLRDAEGHLVVTQMNARSATRYDDRWEGVAEAIQPTIDAIRAALKDRT